MKVIILSGKAGSGKSYNADILKKHIEGLGKSCKIYSFATPIKSISHPIIEESFGSDMLLPENKEIVRPIYQAVGSVGRDISADYWANKTKAIIERDNVDFAVIDDGRFKNEIEVFDQPVSIRLTRGGLENLKNPDDISENALNGYHFDFTVPEVAKHIDEIIGLFDNRGSIDSDQLVFTTNAAIKELKLANYTVDKVTFVSEKEGEWVFKSEDADRYVSIHLNSDKKSYECNEDDIY